MAYYKVPDNIELQLMDRTDESTLGGEHNGVFLTWENLTAGLRFPVPALVKQFFAFHLSAPCSYQPQRNSYFDRVLRVEPPILTQPLIVELCIIYFMRIG